MKPNVRNVAKLKDFDDILWHEWLRQWRRDNFLEVSGLLLLFISGITMGLTIATILVWSIK